MAKNVFMKRRKFLKLVSAIPFFPFGLSRLTCSAVVTESSDGTLFSRVRFGELGWPSQDSWESLNKNVDGQLVKLNEPFSSCIASLESSQCKDALVLLDNTFAIGDEPSLTQTSGWVNAWTSQPSNYAVTARSTEDVVSAVNFAREHKLRLVIKGGGHSYQGTSSSPDSLLVWTRHMNDVTLQDKFVAQGSPVTTSTQPAVTLRCWRYVD